MRQLSSVLVAIGLMVSVAACHNDDPVGPHVALSGLVPDGAVQAEIQQETPSADGLVTFVVRVVAKGVGVSAYQGAVTFEPGAFDLVAVSTPPGGDDESYVLNSADFASGRIRFAAFTPHAFAGTDAGDGIEALRFTVRAVRPVAQADLTATLDVVGKETGTAVSADHVFTSRGVHDAADRLMQ